MSTLKIIFLALSLGTIIVHASPTCITVSSNTRNCTVDIIENIPSGTLVFNADGYFSNQFQILFVAQSPYVNLFNDNFQTIGNKIYTSGDFDRETMVQQMTAPFPVSLVVNIIGLPSQDTIKLLIRIIDINDNIPIFQIGTNFYEGGDTYHLFIFDSPSINTILNVKLVDYDEGINGTCLVTLKQTTPPTFNMSIKYIGNHPFVIEIFPIVPLNHEIKDSYTFQLNAFEGITNPASAVLNVNVTVLDANNNTPIFIYTKDTGLTVFNISIEESDVNSTLGCYSQLIAEDPDQGVNGIVSYSVVSPSSDFEIYTNLQNNVCLRNLVNIDRERNQSLTIVIKAQDNGVVPRSSELTIIVTVLNKNDNKPTVYPPSPRCISVNSNTRNCTVDIIENIPSGTLVFNADDYFSNQFQILFVAQSPYVNLFNDNFQTIGNKIYTSGDFDRETMVQQMTAPFPVSLVVNIIGLPSQDTIKLLIRIIDINDNIPIFQIGTNFYEGGDTYHLFIFDSPSINTILNVKLVDYDEGINGTSVVTLKQTTPPTFNMSIKYIGNHPFVIEIFPIVPLNHEIKDSYTFQLNAFEGITNPASAVLNVNVTVLDANNNTPIFIYTKDTGLTVFNISIEESDVNSTLGCYSQLIAEDPDQGVNGIVSYSVVSPSSDFEIYTNLQNNVCLRNLVNIDRERNQSLTIVIKAQDNGVVPRSSELTIIVTVLNKNDNKPTVYPPSPRCISVNSNTQNCTVYIIENIPSGTLVFNADDYFSNQFQILFVAQSPYVNLFNDNFQTIGNKIYTSGDFDRETMVQQMTAPFPVSLVVNIIGLPSQDTIKLLIRIIDINDNIPIFQIGTNFYEGGDTYHLFIFDSPSINTILNVKLVDYDEGINGTCLVTLKQTDQAAFNMSIKYIGNHPFVIEIFPIVPLNHEIKDSYTFQLNAFEGITNPASAVLNVNVTVLDANNNTPIFIYTKDTGLTVFNISIEESDVNSTLGCYSQLIAEDPDQGVNGIVSYSVISPSSDFGIYTNLQNNVCLRNLVNIDRERNQSLTIVIKAQDNGVVPRSSELTIIVTVLDKNDNKPTVHPPSPRCILVSSNTRKCTVDIIENIPSGTLVFNTDDYFSDQFQILIFPESPYISLFNDNFQSIGNKIYTSGDFDRETMVQWIAAPFPVSLIVRIVGLPSQYTIILLIRVIDINDNMPKFQIGTNINEGGDSMATNHPIPENATNGTIVVTFNASDPDEGNNGRVSFQIHVSNSSSDFPFALNSTSGELYVNGRLDADKEPTTYQCTITAKDKGTQPKSAMVMVTITVTGVNDNPPIIIKVKNITDSVSEGFQSPVAYLKSLKVTDYDVPAAGIDYKFISGGKYFEIDQTFIEVGKYVLKPRNNAIIDREKTPEIFVSLLFSDNGNPPLFTWYNTTIIILDINDNPPIFENTSYMFNVSHDASVNSDVGSVLAVDADSGENAIVAYNLTNNTYFEITSNGVIHVARSLAGVGVSTHYFTVIAYNPNNQAMNESVSVEITILYDTEPTSSNNLLIFAGISGSVVVLLFIAIVIVAMIICLLCICKYRYKNKEIDKAIVMKEC